MPYSILFFCLFWGYFTPIQANYAPSQTANYLYPVVEIDVYSSLEPVKSVKPKKAKKIKKASPQFKHWDDEDWVTLSICFSALLFILGLIFFPYAFIGGWWWWQGILWLELFGILVLITTFFLLLPKYKGSDNWGNGLIMASPILTVLLFLALKGIELIALGLALSIFSMSLIGILSILISIVVLLLVGLN